MIKKWELLESKEIFDSKFITLFKEKLKRSDGKIVEDFFSVKRRDAVFIVALTTKEEVVLVNQYKNGVKEVIWEIPAGFIEESEESESAAQRELLEETGYQGKTFKKVGQFVPNTGISPNTNFVYFVENAEKVADQKLDSNEEIEVKTFSLKEMVKKIKNQTTFLIDTQSQLALLLIWESLQK